MRKPDFKRAAGRLAANFCTTATCAAGAGAIAAALQEAWEQGQAEGRAVAAPGPKLAHSEVRGSKFPECLSRIDWNGVVRATEDIPFAK